jgi:acyl carrier protein
LRFIDLIFGLTEGWWRFADLDLRPEHPLLDAGAWQALLGDCGFRPAGNVSAARAAGSVWSTQAVMVAEAVPIPVAADGAAQRWLILAPAGSPLAEALRQEVEAAGHAATLVLAAAGESPAGADFGIGPGCVADFERLLTRTAALPGTLVHIVDLWPSADADDPARAGVWGCEAALHLVQAVAGAGMPASPALWFVTQDAQPLGERCALRGVLQSPLAGFAKVLALEHPELRCACVDFGAENDPADAACRLLAEIRRGPTGEAQIAYRAGRRHVARLARAAAVAARPGFSIRPDATYLITGGQRGLGLETAKWLVERGARSLVLLGRTDATPEIAPELAALQRAGVVVEALQADVADAGQLARVLASIDSRLPPLRGIVHSAGVLDDGILAQQTVERFRRVLAPKVLGAWNLHVQTRGRPLDFFVMYSSLASLLGSAGQANHAAANAFLDALAHHRQALGLPALSINWGVWSDIGAAARHRVGQRVKTQGMGTIAPAQGMRILEHLLARPAAQVGVAPIDWAVFARRAGAGAHAPFFARFAAGRAPVDAAVPVVTADLGRTLAAAPEAERSARIAELVRDHVAGVLRLATGEVDTGLPLNRIGLDSLMAVELRNRLRAQLGLDVALVRFMEDTSISGLAAELAAELSQPARSVGEASSAPDEASLLARLDALSDREVDALLAATLAGSPQR